jgi:periplasmic protein TonB
MRFEAWSAAESDPGRRKRLAIGYLTAIAICTGVGVVAASVKGTSLPFEAEEEVLDVQLAPTAEPPKEAPPPPPPEAVAVAPRGPAPPKGHKPIEAPTSIPSDKPPEGDPDDAKPTDDDPYGGPVGSPNGVVGGVPGGTGTGAPTAPPAPPAPPPPPPKPAGPVQLTENDTPAEAISTPQPPYPEQARSDGVEATVVVRFVVTETGDVTNVTVVRGHPLFDAGVLATVKGWRFKPALHEGRPIASYRVARIPFKLKK